MSFIAVFYSLVLRTKTAFAKFMLPDLVASALLNLPTSNIEKREPVPPQI